MGALLPLVGKAPAVANPAEKAVLVSSFETFLITSILDTICLPLGGFSGTESGLWRMKLERTKTKEMKRQLNALTPHTSMGSHCARLNPRLSSCFRVQGRLNNYNPH